MDMWTRDGYVKPQFDLLSPDNQRAAVGEAYNRLKREMEAQKSEVAAAKTTKKVVKEVDG